MKEHNKDRIFITESKIKQEIKKTPDLNEYKIKIKSKKIIIPKNILKLVDKKWYEFKLENPKIAKDNTTYFFNAFNKDKGIDYVFPEKFRYAYAFGRCADFQNYSWLSDSQELCALSSLCLVLTSDNKLIFGLKSNMADKISGFSGYTLKEKQETRKNFIDLNKYISRTICDELNIDKEDISKIFRIGQTYSPNINDKNNKLSIKVFNNDYLVIVNKSSLEIKDNFKDNFQFRKILFVDNTLEIIKEFVLNNCNKMSLHCVAAIYNYLILEYKSKDLEIYKEKLFKKSIILISHKKIGKATTSFLIKEMCPLNWGLFGGKNIKGYTIADKMWQALFNKKNMPINYFLFGDNRQRKIFSHLNYLNQSREFIGANIAMPWKKKFYKKCNWVEDNLLEVKTVNTLVKENNILKGYNSDGIGLINAIKDYTNLENKNILLLGAGGASQTVPFWLIKENISQLYIFDINKKRTNDLINSYLKINSKKEIIGLNDKEIKNIICHIDVLINATPCGMKGENKKLPLDKSILKLCKKSCLFVEMIYNPNLTPFLKYAKQRGNIACQGVNMLVEQAAVSFSKAFRCELNKEEKDLMKKVALQGVNA
jgi:shikimate dehydrogenase